MRFIVSLFIMRCFTLEPRKCIAMCLTQNHCKVHEEQQTQLLSCVSSFVLTSCILPPFSAKSELEALEAQLSSTHKL